MTEITFNPHFKTKQAIKEHFENGGYSYTDSSGKVFEIRLDGGVYYIGRIDGTVQNWWLPDDVDYCGNCKDW